VSKPDLTDQQRTLLLQPFTSKILLTGAAGSGKTTAGVARLLQMVGNGIPARIVLVLVPQRSLGIPYMKAIQNPDFPAGGEPAVVTLGGLAQRMLSLFWPLIARQSGFAHPDRPPQFLTLESAQYYLARVVQPYLQRGYFENITVDPNRLYSQILDNLNKSAVVGFPLEEISVRLKKAWVGSSTQLQVYDQAQECAVKFREYCMQNNLLDFSLQFELFTQKLWNTLLCREFLTKSYRHLIYDNIEEDVPVVHDVISEWLPRMDSALLIQDDQGGLRSFLGADPLSAQKLGGLLPEKHHFEGSLVQSDEVCDFREVITRSLREKDISGSNIESWKRGFEVQSFRFNPEMLDWTVAQTSQLIHNGIEPGEICILSPFLSDSQRFSLVNRFEKAGIATKTFRPSRSLKDEPVVRALLCFARLAYPNWHLQPTRLEVCQALAQVLEGADLVRANLIAQTLYQPGKPEGPFMPFDSIIAEMQSRITYTLGERYTALRQWLIDFRANPVNELDIFLSRLFGEILSTTGFQLHQNLDAASVTARLIESARKFRQSVQSENVPLQIPLGKEYVSLLENGLIAAQSIIGWKQQFESNAVLIAPAFTFLMSNRPVRYQFWLDIGSHGWWSRLDQPLTQPYVLNRQWDPADQWTEAFEFAVNQGNLERLVSGLLHRCREGVFLGISGMNEQGNEERGELVRAVQSLRRVLVRAGESDRV
jgi:superfamily I DNA/RNA helicase